MAGAAELHQAATGLPLAPGLEPTPEEQMAKAAAKFAAAEGAWAAEEAARAAEQAAAEAALAVAAAAAAAAARAEAEAAAEASTLAAGAASAYALAAEEAERQRIEAEAEAAVVWDSHLSLATDAALRLDRLCKLAAGAPVGAAAAAAGPAAVLSEIASYRRREVENGAGSGRGAGVLQAVRDSKGTGAAAGLARCLLHFLRHDTAPENAGLRPRYFALLEATATTMGLALDAHEANTAVCADCIDVLRDVVQGGVGELRGGSGDGGAGAGGEGEGGEAALLASLMAVVPPVLVMAQCTYM
jgi:hypothetical protein